MATLFRVIGLGFFILALPTCAAAKSAMHETNGVLFVLIGALFFVGGSIIQELRQLREPRDALPDRLKGPGDKDPAQRKASRFFNIG